MESQALTRAASFLVITAILAVHMCKAKVYMNVAPYPARVYKGAPAGVYVLTVQAYDNVTGNEINNFRLENTTNGGIWVPNYFSITELGQVETATTIDKEVGFQFKFFVFAIHPSPGAGEIPNNKVEWKHVIIEVSVENTYAPTFTEENYNMAVYRYTELGTVIGSVSAVDKDQDPYNSHFTIYAPPRQNQGVLKFVRVMPSGDIILRKKPDDDISVLNLLIRADDNGSPRMTGTTTVTIVIDDVKQPDTFCLATTENYTTLCWKNPMPNRSYPGYNIDVVAPNVVLHRHADADPLAVEYCIQAYEMKIGQNYTFRVTLDTNVTPSTVGIELTFQKLGPGISIDCIEENFAACNFLQPCKNGATCTMGPKWGLDYTCDCPAGWQGQNCTQEDLCATRPCQNEGDCSFLGHQDYLCDCPPNYFGKLCQYHNVCAAANPCKNGGVCRLPYDNGTYTCECPDHFTGDDCSEPDPCSPTPCGEGGQCLKIPGNVFTCSCYRGYYGEMCDMTNVCELDNPCKNAATCTSTGNHTMTCTCPKEYAGTYCDIENSCLTVCQNNATCTLSEDGQYNCTCLPAYYGTECQHFNRCHDNPCTNGKCNMDSSMDQCDCDPGYHGPLCEEYDPCLTNPCNDHGDCQLTPEDEREHDDLPYECECYDSWWGLHCEFADVCPLGVCHNGATCQNTAPNTFSCRCLAGYYESDCSKHNPCLNPPEGRVLCENGGTCHNTSTSLYWCACPDGYYGDHCEHLDPCASSPCYNEGKCTNLTDTQYNCTCGPGFSGDRCQDELSCSHQSTAQSLCVNGGTCILDGAPSPTCTCPLGFVGMFCQIWDPCSEADKGSAYCSRWGSCETVDRTDYELTYKVVEKGHDDPKIKCHCVGGRTGPRCEVESACQNVTCQNGGSCKEGRCVCTLGFTGSTCDTTVSHCTSNPCPDGLVCKEDRRTGYTCICRNGLEAPNCKPVCRSEGSPPGKTGRFFWPQVFAGETALVACPYDNNGENDSEYDDENDFVTDDPSNASFAMRPCLPVGDNEAEWGAPDDSSCSELGLLEASRRLNALSNLTSNPSSLRASQVNNYTTIIEELYVYTLMDEDVASVMMNVISNLADVNVSITVLSNQDNKTSERLVKVLEDYTAEVNVTTGGNVTLTSPNFEVVALLTDDTSSDVTYTPSVKLNDTNVPMGVSITIPPEAFGLDVTSVDRKQNRLQMIGHRKSQFFIPGNSNSTASAVESQPVVSAIVTGKRVLKLSKPVVYKIRNLQTKSNYTCVFWDPKNRNWSTDGVITTVKSGNSTECQSFHLTSFAVLLDPSPDFLLSPVHETVLSYISYIGSAVSLFCLMLTIITYGLFRSLNKDKSGKILLHLCVALLFLNAVFLASGLASSDSSEDDLDDHHVACTTVAVLLHYMLLASLAWMLVEAVEMYRALVTVFAQYAQCYMLKRCLIGWGVPIVIVAITLGVDVANYETDGAFCFISQANLAAYYGSLVAPACIVLVINIVIFVMVARVILKPRFQQQKQKESEGITPSQVRGAFTVMFLLGVTWVFGPLAINESKVVFNYVFCILNSLQGFLIFVFRCLLNPEVRLCWLQLIKTGTLKKRRGPIQSHVYSESSSKADGKSGTYHNGGGSSGGGRSSAVTGNGSSTATTKTSLMQGSNGWHPKLNGLSGSNEQRALERRGTKFSSVDMCPSGSSSATPSPQESSRKGKQQPILTKDERYGDGGGGEGGGADDSFGTLDADPRMLTPSMDYYETGHKGKVKSVTSSPAVGRYDDEEFHVGEGDVMEYYESIRPPSSRREDAGGSSDASGSNVPLAGSGSSG